MSMQYIIKFSFLFLTYFSVAQQEPQFTMFWNNYSLNNPANTGVNYNHYANINYRAQWDKVENAPRFLTAVYEFKIDKYNSGLGVGYFKNNQVNFDNNRVYLNYAYHSKDKLFGGNISYGLTLIYSHLVFNPKYITICDGCELQLDKPMLGTSQGKLSVNSGVLYRRQRFSLGISLTQINKPDFNKINYQSNRSLFTMISYDFQLSKNINYKPTVYFKSNFQAFAIELNNLITLHKQYWLGLTYRHNESIGVMGGVDFKEKFRIGYNYDIITNPLNQYSSGSHELVLGFMLK